MCLICNGHVAAVPEFIDPVDLIERSIEVGSHHFLLALSEINRVGALAEIGEHIGDFKEATEHARLASWNLKKCVEIYQSLLKSISKLPISDLAKDMLQKVEFDALHRRVVKDGLVADESVLWNEVVTFARNINPVGAVQLFVDKAENVEKPIDNFYEQLSNGKFDPQELHRILTHMNKAATVGQIIAQINLETKRLEKMG